MHRLQAIDTTKPFQTTHPDVRLEKSNHKDPGYLLITATDEEITFDYYTVPFDGSAPSSFDSVTV